MIVLLLVSFLALLFTYLEGVGKVINGLKLGILLVSTIAAIHYDFGSDYPVYFGDYKEFINSNYSLSDILKGNVVLGDFGGRVFEVGWTLLMYIFSPFGITGFFLLVAFISYFQGAVVFQLIKKYVPDKWRVFALFIYLFNTSLYVGSMSGLRQTTAMTIVACALPLILNRKWLKSLLVVLLAFFIHKSAIILLHLFSGVILVRKEKNCYLFLFWQLLLFYTFLRILSKLY